MTSYVSHEKLFYFHESKVSENIHRLQVKDYM